MLPLIFKSCLVLIPQPVTLSSKPSPQFFPNSCLSFVLSPPCLKSFPSPSVQVMCLSLVFQVYVLSLYLIYHMVLFLAIFCSEFHISHSQEDGDFILSEA